MKVDNLTISCVTKVRLMFYSEASVVHNACWPRKRPRRGYDPQLGRFAQADSIVPAGVQGYDRYAYGNNSPVNFSDPSGHLPCDEDGVCYDHTRSFTFGHGEDYARKSKYSKLEAYAGPCVSVICLPKQPEAPEPPSLLGPLLPTPGTLPSPCLSNCGTSTQSGPPLNYYVEGLSIGINYIIDVTKASPLMWRKAFTIADAVNPFPAYDAIIGAAGQVITDASNPNLSYNQMGTRMVVAGAESFGTGIASDLIGFGVAAAGGGPYGYAGAQVVSSLVIDFGIWPKINHAKLGAEYGY